jgi:hypothetical protein
MEFFARAFHVDWKCLLLSNIAKDRVTRARAIPVTSLPDPDEELAESQLAWS